MTIGIALFVLIIIAGLIIGLRLSSTSPQRRAVAVAFVLMAVVAGLFWGVAMGAAQVWTAPFFAIACIVVPVAAYTGIMKASKGARPEPKRREDTRGRAAKASPALEAAVMPVAPNHPVNEFLDLHTASDEGADEAAEEELVATSEAPKADTADEAAEVEAEAAESDAAAEHADAAASEGASAEAPGAAPEDEGAPQRAEAFIEEYLVDENEGEDGMFEPEAAPSLHPRKSENHTTSTMVLTVPFAEGDEQYLVVSDTTSVPNPIMAYKRSTSSHLVPLGTPRRGVHAKPVEAASEKASRQEAAPAAKGRVDARPASPMPQVEEPVELEEPALGEPPASVDFAALYRKEPPAAAPAAAPQLELDFTPRPESPFKPAFQPFAKHGAPAPAPASPVIPADEPAAPKPERASAPAPAPAPAPASAPVSAPVVAQAAPAMAPAPVEPPAPAADRPAEPKAAEPAEAPARSIFATARRKMAESSARSQQPASASAPVAAPAPEAVSAAPAASAPMPAAAASAAPASEHRGAASAPAPVRPASPAPTPAPFQAAPTPVVAPVPAPAPAEPVVPAPAAASAPAATPEPVAPALAPTPEPTPTAVPAPGPATTRDACYEEFLGKAQGLRDKGLFPVAARLYGEAAAAASSSADARRARFEEMACYVKAGQGDKARALAAELRRASVLTRVERIKLDAVERMG